MLGLRLKTRKLGLLLSKPGAQGLPRANVRFRVLKSPESVVGGTESSIQLEFNPTAIAGRIQTKLSIRLRANIGGSESVLDHQLSVTVSQQAVLDAAAAVRPFEPLRPKPRRAKWKYGLHGERLEFRNNIVWTEELPEFEIPATIRDSILWKNLDEQEDAVAGILPEPTSNSAHATFWSSLLHVEELQVS